MKIIDLLNRIAKGEEVPQNIKYNDLIWFWCEGCQIYETNNEDGKCINLYSWFTTEGNLNDEVENLEEVEDKKYEDIEVYDYADNHEVMYPNTIANNFVHLNEDLKTITGAIKYILERLDK